MKRWIAVLCVFFASTGAESFAGDQALRRIAFGSCAHQNLPLPIFDAIVKTRPELFLFLGDNIYADYLPARGKSDVSRKDYLAKSLREKYEDLAKLPGFRRLRKACPLLATWDDHDYGLNDAGEEFVDRVESQKIFLDFFGIPKDSPRRKQDGIFHAAEFGPEDRRVQVLLLDTRYFRSALKERKVPPGIGPYVPDPDPMKTMLGAAQWRWLEEQLRRPARLRLLVSSIQVVPEDHGWEKWMNLPAERDRLFALIRSTGAAGVVCLSGDRHLAELSVMDAGIGYPLFDLTSSGLNMAFTKWREQETNRHRVATMNHGHNFGMIEIDWDHQNDAGKADPLVRLRIHDEAGEVALQEKIPLSLLQPGTLKGKGGPIAAKLNGEPLTPERAQALVGKEAKLEMLVRSTGMSKKSGLIFLNAAGDHTQPDNFTVVLDRKVQAALAEAGIAAPRTHFQGKRIAVTGTVSLFGGKPQIIVASAAHLRLAE